MKNLFHIFIIAIISLFLVDESWGDTLTPAEEEIYNSIPDEWNVSDSGKLSVLYGYFNGLGQGIEWAGTFHKIKENSPLYCPLSNEYFRGDKFFQIYKSQYYSRKELYDRLGHYPGAILLEGLINKYPCD